LAADRRGVEQVELFAVRDRRACPGGAIIDELQARTPRFFILATAGLAPAGPSLTSYNLPLAHQ